MLFGFFMIALAWLNYHLAEGHIEAGRIGSAKFGLLVSGWCAAFALGHFAGIL